jgi:membrane associated rhomboid family serine protease
MIGKRVGIEWRSMLVTVVINFVTGFVLGGVDWIGHLGGLLGGTDYFLNRTKN